MTWIRELRIADERLRVTVYGLSPEREAVLGRKYAPFTTFHPLDSSPTTLILSRQDGEPRAAENLPLGLDPTREGRLRVETRGLSGSWDVVKRSFKAEFINDLPHSIENAIRFVTTRQLLARGAGCFHAAAVTDQAGAFVVMGESEAGKTTLSQIFGRHHTLSDEMPAILPDGKGWQVHATPFWGDMGWGETQGARPLSKIFMLRGKQELASWRLSESVGLQALLARIFNYSSEPEMGKAAHALCQKLARMPIYGLSYPKDIPLTKLAAFLRSAS